MKNIFKAFFVSLIFILGVTPASAWHDETHMAIAKAAGYAKWYDVAGPDVTKIKAGDKEAMNHWYNNNAGRHITPKMVLEQVGRYDRADDPEGHLYGAIVHSLNNYIRDRRNGKYSEYHMVFCAHYIGDLSQPLHNAPYDANNKDDFNFLHHEKNDATVEAEALNNIGLIQKGSYEITINSEDDLAQEIARLANLSHDLYLKILKANRDMTKDEAYTQLSHSVSLLRAVLNYAERMR